MTRATDTHRATEPVGRDWRVFACGVGTVAVRVEVGAPDVADWLTEFFEPWIQPLHSVPRPDATIRVIADGRVPRRPEPDARDEFAAWALDTRLVALPGCRTGDGLTLFDREFDCVYILRGDSQVDVLGTAGARGLRLGAMRVVREILTSRWLARGNAHGRLDIHGAAFATAGRAVIVAGPKGAGKTTLVSYALSSTRAGLVSNDRVLVDLAPVPSAFGVPTLVSARRHTLRLFPRLVGTGGEARLQPVDGPAAEAGELESGRAVQSLSLQEFATRLHAPCERGAVPLGAVLFTEIDCEVDDVTIDPIPARRAVTMLSSCLYGRPGQRQHNATVFAGIGDRRHDVVDTDRTLSRLAGSVVFMRCRLGRRAYGRPATEWITAVQAVLHTTHSSHAS